MTMNAKPHSEKRAENGHKMIALEAEVPMVFAVPINKDFCKGRIFLAKNLQ